MEPGAVRLAAGRSGAGEHGSFGIVQDKWQLGFHSVGQALLPVWVSALKSKTTGKNACPTGTRRSEKMGGSPIATRAGIMGREVAWQRDRISTGGGDELIRVIDQRFLFEEGTLLNLQLLREDQCPGLVI